MFSNEDCQDCPHLGTLACNDCIHNDQIITVDDFDKPDYDFDWWINVKNLYWMF